MAAIWKQPISVEILQHIHHDTAVAHLGIEFLAVGDNTIRARVPVDARTRQPYGLLHGGVSVVTLAAAPDAVATAGAVAAAAPADELRVTVRPVDDAAAARDAVRAGTGDAWLHRDAGTWTLTTRNAAEEELETVAAGVVRDTALEANLAGTGLTRAALERGSVLGSDFLEGDRQRADVTRAASFAFSLLFFLSTITFGSALAGSVVEEKQSRIVEIVATAVPLRSLLIGKVAGNTALALGQQAIYLGVGLIGLSLTDYSAFGSALTGPAAWFLVFFLAGFVMLACLFAVAGSLASRQEDLQATAAPLTLVTTLVYVSGFLFTGQAAVIGSYVPPLSIVLMPARLLQGTATWADAAVALALLLLTAALGIRVAARLYARSLLQTGGRVGLRQAWSAPV